MPIFRKRPVKVEAVQWDGSYDSFIKDIKPFCENSVWVGEPDSDEPYIIIPTLEGDHRAIPDDYIIKGVKGEFYPCKEGIFHLTYEAVGF